MTHTIIQYPTMKEVEQADRFTLCKWWRFLDSPGMHGGDIDEETRIMNRIAERFSAAGGITVEISKRLGWR